MVVTVTNPESIGPMLLKALLISKGYKEVTKRLQKDVAPHERQLTEGR